MENAVVAETETRSDSEVKLEHEAIKKAATRRAPTNVDVMNTLRIVRNTLRKDKDILRSRLSDVSKSVREMQNEIETHILEREEKNKEKIEDAYRIIIQREITKACERIVAATYQASVAKDPDGALAAINQLAVESLFLLDRRVRTNRGGKRVGLREALCNVESLTMGNMRSIKSEIYKKTGPEGALLAEALKALTGGEEE
jgi:hypothetical protein